MGERILARVRRAILQDYYVSSKITNMNNGKEKATRKNASQKEQTSCLYYPKS